MVDLLRRKRRASAAEPATPDDADMARMSLIEHLTELRNRLIKAVVALTVFSIVGFVLSNRLLHWLVEPYCQVQKGKSCALVVLDPLEGFATRLKVSIFFGAMAASPVILWQVWRFITPGLHKRERRYAIPFVASSIALFCAGGYVAIATFPKALEFLIGVGGPNLVPLFSPSRYLRLFILVVVAFGVSFEFPIVLVFLELAHVLTPARLSKSRRGAIVGIFIFAAVITPSQDPITLFAMAIPMCVFYEASILVGRLMKR